MYIEAQVLLHLPSRIKLKKKKTALFREAGLEMDFPSSDREDKMRSIVPAVLWSWQCKGKLSGLARVKQRCIYE